MKFIETDAESVAIDGSDFDAGLCRWDEFLGDIEAAAKAIANRPR